MALWHLLALCVFAGLVVLGSSLQCYQCGQYNDGVGSITPCINETYMKLMECPKSEHIYCIKYINEGSTVRDCVPKCTERDKWDSKTFCCSEDGCNGAFAKTPSLLAVILLALLALH